MGHVGTAMGWQRRVGSLKIKVSFFKKKSPYFCRALSQKRPENLGSLRNVATAYGAKSKDQAKRGKSSTMDQRLSHGVTRQDTGFS